MGAEDLILRLEGLFEQRERPDADQRTAAYWWGARDEAVAWALSLCRLVARDPISQHLYIAQVAEDARHIREIKDWGYRIAAEYAATRGPGQRGRRLVEGYRPDWGHQAARDGLAIALWPHLRAHVPGIGKRCEALGCGKQGFQRIRDDVERQARYLIEDFRLDMQEVLDGRFSRDFIARWEAVTGREWTG